MKRLVASHAQHFLRSPAFIAELVGHSNIRSPDTVVDIGAGSGAITAVLARRAARVIAVEREPTALARLRSNLHKHPGIEIVADDALSFPLPESAYKVFANIPFSLSSPIVRRLTAAENPPRSIYLIVQKQFAQKMLVDDTKHFHGALGVAIAPWWVARIRRPLRKADYTPPPAVDTVLLELKPRSEPLLLTAHQSTFMKFVEACFHDPKRYHAAGGRHDKKPSELSLDGWIKLFERS